MKKVDEVKNMKTPDNKQNLFEFAQAGDRIHDAKFETKPIGYFEDAMIRFTKNKGSVVAGIIILLLVLFAIFVPIFSNEVAATTRDAQYKKMGPRTTWGYNIGMNGSRSKDYNQYILLNYYGIGVAAEYKYDEATKKETFATLAEGKKSEFCPVIKEKGTKEVYQGHDKATLYYADIDTYLGVGFSYEQIELSDYEKMRAWEKETGKTLFYPLINENSPYTLDGDNPNYWYKMSTSNSTKGAPLDDNDMPQRMSDKVEFIDIYLRDIDGNPIYTVEKGSGYKVRVLYYNYYQYKYGQEPEYIFGTDAQGYDLAYRMATGMRLSFLLAVSVSVINFIIGTIYGAVEGYYGGAVDLILERISDILVEVPFVVVATLFQLHFSSKVGAFPSLLFAFVLTGWIGTASRVRTQFYRFKTQEYVLAARTLGASDARIMWKHIYPNTLGTIITSSVLVIPGVIFSESMLSYLGIVSLGDAKSTSLGTLISEASGIWVDYPHLMIFPAIVISLLEICFNLFGNGLRDAFNPQLRGADE